MKRLIIVGVIVVGIICVSVYARHSIDSARTQLHSYTQQILDYIEQEDIPSIERTVGQLVDYWAQEQRHLLLFIRHAEIDEISRSVSRLKAYTKDKQDHSDLSAELRSIAWQIDHIWQSDRVTIGRFVLCI